MEKQNCMLFGLAALSMGIVACCQVTNAPSIFKKSHDENVDLTWLDTQHANIVIEDTCHYPSKLQKFILNIADSSLRAPPAGNREWSYDIPYSTMSVDSQKTVRKLIQLSKHYPYDPLYN